MNLLSVLGTDSNNFYSNGIKRISRVFPPLVSPWLRKILLPVEPKTPPVILLTHIILYWSSGEYPYLLFLNWADTEQRILSHRGCKYFVTMCTLGFPCSKNLFLYYLVELDGYILFGTLIETTYREQLGNSRYNGVVVRYGQSLRELAFQQLGHLPGFLTQLFTYSAPTTGLPDEFIRFYSFSRNLIFTSFFLPENTGM